jgi:hypothetical protein
MFLQTRPQSVSFRLEHNRKYRALSPLPQVLWTAQDPGREHDDRLDKREYSFHGDPDEPERQEDEPHERIEDQGEECQGPA